MTQRVTRYKEDDNMKTKEFSFRKRAQSFRFAFNGIKTFFREEHNARIHFAATVAVFTGAWLFQLPAKEIILLVMVTGFVWAAEVFNTAIEKIMDFISPEPHPEVKRVKDLSAAAVLIAALTALITGAVIFIPKFL
ncbi:MAG TPA: diacylglycerol kinase family protein [Chitinophagaceae bacterium]